MLHTTASLAVKALRGFFYHFYHGLAWTYDFVAAVVSLGQWNKWVCRAANYVEGPRVLELGHGPGHLQLHLYQQGLQTFGLDESRQMIRQAQRRLRKNNQAPCLVRGISQRLPYCAAFQTVVATFPAEYIYDSTTIEEIRRVLVPGGILVILIGAWIGGQSVPERLTRWLFRITHQGDELNEPVLERMKAPFRRAGFRVEDHQVRHASSSLYFLLARKPKSVVK